MYVPEVLTIERDITDKLRDSFSKNYTNIQSYYPTMGRLAKESKKQCSPCFDSSWKISQRIESEGMGGNGKSVVELEKDGVSKIVPAFIKTTHILEPVTFMKGQYGGKKANVVKMQKKVQEPMNQAYIDALASFLVGKFRDSGLTPHFCEYYGAFSAEAEKYYYNMSDEYESFRNKRWFWTNKENGEFDFKVFINENEPIPEDMKEFFEKPEADDLSDSSNDTEDDKSLTIEELDNEKILCDNASMHSASISFKSDEEESDDEESDSEIGNEINIYAEFKKFPAMLICMEKNEDTLDSLLISEEFEEGWDKKWLAWLFQVVCALIQIQAVFDMTHNDLHTNNILWANTEEEFIYYKENGGQVWRVPTFGKIFRIIDFGRSIFTINKSLFYSDDFLTDHDAGDQYNFGPFYNTKKTKVEPNKSFDLSRLASGLYEEFYEDDMPERLIGGHLLSKEDTLEVWETESNLHDMLWTWLLDDEGKNILIRPNGDERFPGFDLYQHIAAHVHKAVPVEQLRKKWFAEFKSVLPEGKTAYPLFA